MIFFEDMNTADTVDIKTLFRLDLQFFAKDGPGGEKTEEPTSKKLSDARDEGQVAKSREIPMAASLLGLFISLRALGNYLGNNMTGIFSAVYGNIADTANSKEFTNVTAMYYLRYASGRVIMIGLPFLIMGFIIAFLSNLLQVKWKVTTKPLQPKLDKFNPINGFKRIFSMNTLFELFKSILKVVCIFLVAFMTVKDRAAEIFILYDLSLNRAIAGTCNLVIDVGMRISLIYAIIAVIDFIYQRKKFHDDMMMTKQEIKDEMKNSEGDPHIKGQQRQRMQQASRRRMMQNVPKADVVITNPTHYAVALKYDGRPADGGEAAPKVVAKGADYVAQKIKEIAKENGVEIVENKPLARMLYANIAVDQAITPDLYEAVAEILAYVYAKNNKLPQGSGR